MSYRATVTEVRKLIPDVSKKIDLVPFIRRANAITNYVVTKDISGLLTDELLYEIETNLAAHYYAKTDQQYSAKSTGGASGTFQGQTGMGFDYSPWGQDAKSLDVTGTLAMLDETAKTGSKKIAKIRWIGNCPPPDYDCNC